MSETKTPSEEDVRQALGTLCLACLDMHISNLTLKRAVLVLMQKTNTSPDEIYEFEDIEKYSDNAFDKAIEAFKKIYPGE
jgi:hypothetical protein